MSSDKNPPELDAKFHQMWVENEIREILGEEDWKYTDKPHRIQAIITTETTMARIDELEALKQNTWSTDKCWEELNERLDKLHTLQKEQL